MAIKYIITKDKVQDTFVTDSEYPVQSKVIKAELDKKLNKAAEAGDVGKVAMVKETGTSTGVYELQLETIPSAAQADWNQTDTAKQDFIKNKPFKAVGTGLTVKEIAGIQTLTADYQLHFQVYDTLPTPASAAYAQIIALVRKTPASTEFYEYACVNAGTTESPSWKWEMIGAVDLQIEQTDTAIKINGTALNTADDTKIGLMSATDHTDMQRKTNLVQDAWSTTTSNTKYPSEKLVKDSLDTKQATANLVTTIAAAATADDTKYPSEKATRTELDARVKFSSTSTSKLFTVGVDSNGYYIEE